MHKIAIVTNEILGPYLGGGIATAVFGLVASLKEKYDVTIIYHGQYHGSWNPVSTESYFKKLGVRWLDLEVKFHVMKDVANLRDVRTRSWLAFEALRELKPDLALFNDYGGLGYYSAIARKNGTDLQNTQILTVMHGPSQWARELNGQYSIDENSSTLIEMERLQTENSDWVSSPSQYIFDWAAQNGWDLDRRLHSVERNIVPLHPIEWFIQNDIEAEETEEDRRSSVESDQANIDEIVFFGRTEIRKGFVEFCDALDLISQEKLARIKKITFLGKPSNIAHIDSTIYIIDRSRNWNFEIEFLEKKSQSEATEYIRSKNRLTIINSKAENAPCVIVESARVQANFLANLTGGTAELLDSDTRDAVSLPTTRRELAAKIAANVNENLRTKKRLSYSHKCSIRRWLERIEFTLQKEHPKTSSRKQPLVSVVMAHHNRPEYLDMAVDAILNQTYKNIEVIIVDDGSSPNNVRLLENIEAKDSRVKVILQENAYLGAARNRGVVEAKGEYVKFNDDDNIPLPNEIDELVRAAETVEADLVTCFSRFFHVEFPNCLDNVIGYYLPIGPSIMSSLFDNNIGDANALVRTEVLRELGGFTTDYGVGYEDYELFLKLMLSGKKATIVPKPLFWYRVSKNSMIQSAISSEEKSFLNIRRILKLLDNQAYKLPDAVNNIISKHFIYEMQNAKRLNVLKSQRSEEWLHNRRKRLTWEFTGHDDRQEGILQAFINAGRFKEAVDLIQIERSEQVYESILTNILHQKIALNSSNVITANLISNPSFRSLEDVSAPKPYAEICPGWSIPHRGPSKNLKISKSTDHPGARQGIAISFSNKSPYNGDHYLMLSTPFNIPLLKKINAFELSVSGFSQEMPFDLHWFVREYTDADFSDHNSIVRLGERKKSSHSDNIHGLDLEITSTSKFELFLSLYTTNTRNIEITDCRLFAMGIM